MRIEATREITQCLEEMSEVCRWACPHKQRIAANRRRRSVQVARATATTTAVTTGDAHPGRTYGFF